MRAAGGFAAFISMFFLFAVLLVVNWALSTALVAIALNGLGPWDFSFSTLAGFGLLVAFTKMTVTTSRS